MSDRKELHYCKSAMCRNLVIAISLAVLILIVIAWCASNRTTRVPLALDYELSTPTINPENADVWRVLPTLEYEFVRRCCMWCNFFIDRRDQSEAVAVDPHTGLPYEYTCSPMTAGSGFFTLPFVYDPQRDLLGHPGLGYFYGRGGGGWTGERMIGMHPFSVFDGEIRTPIDIILFARLVDIDVENRSVFVPTGDFFSRFKVFQPVESVDSSMRRRFVGDAYRVFRLTEDAHSGKFALMYNLKFVTAFVFDETTRLNPELFAVRMGDYWGAIDNNGELILPFVFDRFVHIDNYTAFARYNGKYGIIYLR